MFAQSGRLRRGWPRQSRSPRRVGGRRTPAEIGLDPTKLAEAIAYAQSHETARPADLSDQETIFGALLGSMPTRRARGAGSNPILISPEHDLVVVWRWHAGNEVEFTRRIVAANR